MDSEKLLDTINSPDDLKKLDYKQLDRLCGEIREMMINSISKTGGHLASNLGVVELTVAIHKVFHSPDDQIVWDVGHQCYTHKILTGRADKFNTLRQEGGLSGFPKPCESEHDAFIAGHSSTSISAALGLAKAKSLQGNNDDYTIAVIGDGSLTGGLAYEALNNAGRSHEKLIVILNDNKMSISKNVGAVARHLAVTRSKPLYFRIKLGVERFLLKIPKIGRTIAGWIIRFKAWIKSILYNNTLFENMGFAYLGPVDGHDIKTLCEVLQSSKNIRRPVVLHVCTTKGKGYSFAENDPKHFHGIGCFDIQTGDDEHSSNNFSEYFGQALCEFAEKDDRICAITAAMVPGTGLSKFAKLYRERLFDVGIAEAHAATFSAGLAKNGMLPVFAVYSTFAQRCYDQIIHDAALQKLNVVFAIDRAGIVGEDGETHQGLFDAAFLNSIPNVTILAPSSYIEIRDMLYKAIYQIDGVVALRYPRGSEYKLPDDYIYEGEKWSVYGNKHAKYAIVTYGRIFANACNAAKMATEHGIDICILKLNTIKPISKDAIQYSLKFDKIFFMEEGMGQGGIGEHFLNLLNKEKYHGDFIFTAITDEFVPQSTVQRGLEKYSLDANGMFNTILEECRNDR